MLTQKHHSIEMPNVNRAVSKPIRKSLLPSSVCFRFEWIIVRQLNGFFFFRLRSYIQYKFKTT